MKHLLLFFTLLTSACVSIVPYADGGTDAQTPDAGMFVEIDVGDLDVLSPTDVPRAVDGGPSLDIHTPEGFARAYGERICAAWAVCPRCTLPPAGCPAAAGDGLLVVHDPADFDPERVDAYLALLDDAYAACEQVTALEHASMYPYWGDGMPGDPPETGALCTSPDDCTTRNCQPVGLFAERRCVALPADAPRGPLCL